MRSRGRFYRYAKRVYVRDVHRWLKKMVDVFQEVPARLSGRHWLA